MDHYEEIRLVDELGKQIGYGNIMNIASALWAKGLSDWDGIDISDGAFIPVTFTMIKDDCREIAENSILVERSWIDKYCEKYNRKIEL